jgi:hypothetical protein
MRAQTTGVVNVCREILQYAHCPDAHRCERKTLYSLHSMQLRAVAYPRPNMAQIVRDNTSIGEAREADANDFGKAHWSDCIRLRNGCRARDAHRL